MGNSIGGKRRRARVMTVDGATYKYRPPAAAADALRDHPGHHLLESDEVRRLGVRARPLDPDAPLKPGKLYFLVHLPNLSSRRRAPQRTWSGALTYGGSGAGGAAGAGERLESLMVARRSASDVAASPVAAAAAYVEAAEGGGEDGCGGAVRLRVRLPKADVQRLVDESRDAAEAAERIMQLCVARDQDQQQRRHRSAPSTPLVVPVAAAMPPAITSGSRYSKDSDKKTKAAAGKKEKRARFVTVPDEIIGF
ncbi:unnamed protein product [Urochloa humidicola]